MMNLEDKKRNIEEIKMLEERLAKFLIEHPELDSEFDEEQLIQKRNDGISLKKEFDEGYIHKIKASIALNTLINELYDCFTIWKYTNGGTYGHYLGGFLSNQLSKKEIWRIKGHSY